MPRGIALGLDGLGVGVPAAGGEWWNPDGDIGCPWAAYQPKWAASLLASYTDLTGNGNNTGPGVAPTWDAVNGWKFNGVNQYLATTFVPQNDQTQSMIIQYTNLGALLDALAVAYTTLPVFSGGFGIKGNYAGTRVEYYNGGQRNIVPGLVAGNLAVAGNQGYRNGVAEGAAIGGYGAGAMTDTVPIGCQSVNGVLAQYIDGYIQAFALYDCTLSGAQVASVALAMSLL